MTVGIYLHIPFCENICDYCDFYSVVADERQRDQYVQALNKELITRSEKSVSVDTIYFGGGNPGLLKATQVEQLINTIYDHYRVMDEIEITLECNPESGSEETLSGYKRAGVNRISFGVQSYNQQLVSTLGRQREDAPDVIISVAIKTFPRVSLDLMLGIPGQTLELMEGDLSRIPIELGHVSAYELTLYQGTRLASRIKKGLIKQNSERVDEAVENVLQKQLSMRGLSQYEVSNYAKTGQQAKHNLHYWHYDDYLGFGAGAVSTWIGQRIMNSRLRSYLSGNRIENIERLSIATQKIEWAMMNLRLIEGFTRESYRGRFDKDIIDDFPEVFDKQAHFFCITNERVALTKRGLLFHQAILSELIP